MNVEQHGFNPSTDLRMETLLNYQLHVSEQPGHEGKNGPRKGNQFSFPGHQFCCFGISHRHKVP